MRAHLVKRKTVYDYVKKHPISKAAFMFWIESLKHAEWEKPTDIKEAFNSADFLGQGSDRIVFDIGGNNYRIIYHHHFGETKVHLYICWIGSHAGYDKLCDARKQYTVNLF